jgi:putative ABC transport system substrate-binding protein
MFKKLIAAILLMFSAANAATLSVCIIKTADIEALDKVVEGIVAQLGTERGDAVEVKIESCQGNAGLASQIALKNAKADVIVAVGTLATQVVCKLVESGKCKARVVFTAVTDPLAISPLIRDGKIGGISDYVPVKTQLEWMLNIYPGLKRLGTIYNPGEANSVASLNELQGEAEKLGLTLVVKSVQKTADVQQVAGAIVEKVDAVFINNDNTALSALPTIVKVCKEKKKPVCVSDTDEMKCGCAAACGPDQFKLGQQTGKQVLKVVEGETIGIEYPNEIERHINKKVLREIGLSPDEKVLQGADKVYED